MDWLEFFGYLWLFVVYSLVIRYITLWIQRWDDKRQDRKYLRHLKIEYPDSVITLSAVSSTDEAALEEVKQQLDRQSALRLKEKTWYPPYPPKQQGE